LPRRVEWCLQKQRCRANHFPCRAIRRPAFTSDNTGFAAWGIGYVGLTKYQMCIAGFVRVNTNKSHSIYCLIDK